MSEYLLRGAEHWRDQRRGSVVPWPACAWHSWSVHRVLHSVDMPS